MKTADIHSWLAGVSDSPPDWLVRKRPLSQTPNGTKPIDTDFLPISPPMSHHQCDVLDQPTPPPAKKQKTNTADDQDATPRPALPPPSKHSYSDSASYRSGRSSPRKVLRHLGLRADGVDIRPLSRDDPGLPPSLAEFLERMMDISEGRSAIPAACRFEIEQVLKAAKSQGRTPIRQPQGTQYETPQDAGTALRPVPSMLQAQTILSQAARCQRRNEEEAAWNSRVHYPILQLALHGGDLSDPNALVDVTQCTTATIIKEYLSPDVAGKKVDFVLHITPTADKDGEGDEAAARIEECRNQLPLLSINHTDHNALLKEPIAVSIETKKDAAGGTASEAQVQIGTWMAAQWNLLADLVARRRHADTNNSLKGLAFLPGIVVHGHDWNFVASTRENKKTILWFECPFGSTRTFLDVHKVIRGIELLSTFSKQTYWPWYQKHVLGLDNAQQP